GDETIPEGYNLLTYGYEKALNRAKKEQSIGGFFKRGAQNVLDMWMGVAPIVMAFGLIALILAEFIPVFQWLGMPFIPLLELMQVLYDIVVFGRILISFVVIFLT